MSHETLRHDGELISAYVAGDPAAFEELVRRHGALVLAVCQRVLGRSGEAEEVVQSVFLLLSQKAVSLAGKNELAGWLHRTAWYTATVVLRERRRRANREKEASVASARMSVAGEQRNEMWDAIAPRLDAALHALPEKHRMALAACYLEGRKQEEVAEAMGVPRNVLAGYCRRGLEALRRKLGVRDASLSVAVLGALLTSHATTAFPQSLLTLSSAVATGTASAKVALLADAAGKAMWWAKLKSATAAVLLIGCLGIASAYGVSRWNSPAAASSASSASVVLRGSPALVAFDALRQQGFSVSVLGDRNPTLPVELRFVSVSGEVLVNAVAKHNHFKTLWSPDRKTVVLYAGASDEALAQLRADLDAPDAARRRDAARRAAKLEDIRTVPMLIAAARDADANVQQAARISLRDLNWDAVIAVDAGAWSALAGDASFSVFHRNVGRCPGPQTLALLQRAVGSPDAKIRCQALLGLQLFGGEQAHRLVKEALADADPQVRSQAVSSLARFQKESDVPEYEKILADTSRENQSLRENAVCSLGYLNTPAAFPAVERACTDANPQVRYGAAAAIGNLGGDRALSLYEKMVESPDFRIREGTAYGLASIGGDKALALLKRLMSDPHFAVRSDAIYALREIGGATAEALLQKARTDENADVRAAAATALSNLNE